MPVFGHIVFVSFPYQRRCIQPWTLIRNHYHLPLSHALKNHPPPTNLPINLPHSSPSCQKTSSSLRMITATCHLDITLMTSLKKLRLSLKNLHVPLDMRSSMASV